MCEATTINIFVFMPEQPVSGNVLENWKKLAPREKQISKHIINGLSYAEIALEHSVSVWTVKKQVQDILRKFDLHSREDLRVELVMNGNGDLP